MTDPGVQEEEGFVPEETVAESPQENEERESSEIESFETPQDESPGVISEVTLKLNDVEATIRTNLDGLRSLFEEKIAYDRFKEDQITRLHDELQGYKNDLVAKASRPLIQGLIRLHDDFGKLAEAWKRKEPVAITSESLAEFCKILDGVQDDVGIVLSQNGIEVFNEPGETFNPAKQTAVRTEPTEEASLVGQVFRRVRPGFERDGAVVQKERVEVYSAGKKEAVS